MEEERAPVVDIPGIVRQLMMSKNTHAQPLLLSSRPTIRISTPVLVPERSFWGQPDKSDEVWMTKCLEWPCKSVRMLKRKY